jgi:ribonucleoside-diphosphate reductase alpha chain
MMAAAQPFLSGAISKTVNLPHEATVEDVAEAYAESWRQGIKAVAIYRDGSKGTQPLNVSMDAKKEPSALDAVGSRLLGNLAASQAATEADVKLLEAHGADKVEVSAKQLLATVQAFQRALDEIATAAAVPVLTPAPAMSPATEIPREAKDLNAPPPAIRHRLQEERASLTHKFSIAGHEGYITVGMYPNGQPGEIFIRMAKEGSTVSGLMDAFATSVSLALQHGVPLKVLCEKFAHTRFEPSGWTGNEQIGYAKSLMDYMFRWLNLRFLSGQQLTLFAGLGQQAPQLTASPSMIAGSDLDEDESPTTQQHIARLAEEVAKRLNQVTASGAHSGGGIAPEPQAGPGGSSPRRMTESQAQSAPEAGSSQVPSMQDRGLYHAADAMRGMYDMGDAPSCGTCGAIMVRNGSCYRCMSCGSTSGCS